MNTNMYWAYLHQNMTVQVKRWWGDHEDYKGDCIGNPYVLKVMEPFRANSYDEAVEIAQGGLIS